MDKIFAILIKKEKMKLEDVLNNNTFSQEFKDQVVVKLEELNNQ